ncbi:MAG: patatin-like phospholipase family protein [Candidatus Marinimicrobia bacterium]|nr:patatin-like phospholipase family protein [Candidatus Neomarinimicrobiota bacterium]
MMAKRVKIIRGFKISILLLLLGLSAVSAQDRPKVGVVLSGGGARGFAHVGTLALIDSLNIPVDYIAGTSMGGIIGALYSIGYDPVEIDRLIRNLDWETFFSDDPPRNLAHFFDRKDDGEYQLELKLENWVPIPPDGLISGQNILLELSKYTFAYENVTHFDELPIPFRCMAVDIITGNEVVLESGSLSKAMRSTMSIPTLFDPVPWGDSLLVDGGLLNNVPVQVVKDMGADIIITCNVGSARRSKEELNTLIRVLEQSIYLPGYLREDQNLPLSDIIITPVVQDFNPAVFSDSNIDSILASGYRAAEKASQDLKRLADKHRLAAPQSEFSERDKDSRLYGLQFTGNTTLPFPYLFERCSLTPGDTINVDRVEEAIRAMKVSDRIQDVTYSAIFESPDEVRLKFHVKESHYPRIDEVQIQGNHYLPFSYIYQNLDVHAGDPFNPDQVAHRINQLYSLGVFSTVQYEVKPVDDRSVRLMIKVEEKADNRLRLGWRYDNYHNLVGYIGIVHDNLLLPGMQMEADFQVAGRQRFNIRLFYPLSFKERVTYPYLEVSGVDESRTLYDFGVKTAIYDDFEQALHFGLGFLPTNHLVIEADFAFEKNVVEPEVGQAGLVAWDDVYKQINLLLGFDDLDDAVIPRTGRIMDLNIQRSLAYSKNYGRFEATYASYQEINSRSNIRFYTHLGGSYGLEDLQYKWFHSLGSDDFVGADLYELSWKKFMTFRVDLRHEFLTDWYVKLSYNIAPNPALDGNYVYPPNVKVINGYGMGLLYDSYVGPIEFTFGLGDKLNADDTKSLRYLSYFSAGLKF